MTSSAGSSTNTAWPREAIYFCTPRASHPGSREFSQRLEASYEQVGASQAASTES